MSVTGLGSSAARLRYAQQCMGEYLKQAVAGTLIERVLPADVGEVQQHSAKKFFFTELDIVQLSTFTCVGCGVTKAAQMNWITNEHFLSLKSPICAECSECGPV